MSLLGLGFASGFLSAFFGIGGGIVSVPALTLFFRFPLKRAIGTSLAAILPIAAVGVLTELVVKGENLHAGMALALAAGALVGTFSGKAILLKLGEGALRPVYAAFLLIVALRLSGIVRFGGAAPWNWEENLVFSAAVAAAIGWIAGVSSTLFGIGGGLVAVPLLLGAFDGVVFHEARATALAMIIPTAAAGIWHHRSLRNVDAGAAWRLALPGLAGAALGVVLVQEVASDTLRVLFAILLVLAAWRLLKKPVDSG